MTKLKLLKKFDLEQKFDDPVRNEKNILTDFINQTFFKENINEVRMMKLIYKKIQPLLNKYNLKLLFKGGNTLRLINLNVYKYFPPESVTIIKKIFKPFLKQSDNDFAIYVNPNIKNYELFFGKLNYELLVKLNEIRDILIKNLSFYFYIFNLKKTKYNSLFRELKKNLDKHTDYKINNVILKETRDKEIYFDDIKKKLEDRKILVYENMTIKPNIIYNSLNFGLQFKKRKEVLTSFTLLRSKINFLINDKVNLPGELIDISLNDRYDTHYKNTLNTTEKYNKFIKKNIKKVVDKENKITFYMINLNYMVNDLITILFEQFEFPWADKKYKKRLARLIYFIFLYSLENKSISLKTLDGIMKDFINFIVYLKTLDSKNGCKNIKNIKICKLIKLLNLMFPKVKKKDTEKMINFIEVSIFYSEAIISIIMSIRKYQKGKQRVKQDIYNLNVV